MGNRIRGSVQAATPVTPRRDRRAGNVLPFFLIVSLLFFGAATFSISLGQSYVAHSQLQTIADAGARAAVAMARDGEFELAARDIASLIALRTEAIDAGIFLVNNDIIFGDYDYATRQFSQGGDEFAPAVQVWARRTSASVMGPLQIPVGLFYGEETREIAATSIATVGCREFVFAIDASEGMTDEFAAALQLARDFKDELDAKPRPGDKMGLVFYAGDGATLVEYARSGSPFWSGGTPDALSRLPADGSHVDGGLDGYGFEGTCEHFRDRLPGGGRGSCAGKGDQHGIDRALELFEQMGTDSCSESRERLIVLITSDMPCAVFGPAINDFATPYYGGTRQDAMSAADRADALGVSIAPIKIDRGAPLGGDFCRNHPLAIRASGVPMFYLSGLARGFVEGVITEPGQNELEDLLDDFNKNLAVRVVQ